VRRRSKLGRLAASLVTGALLVSTLALGGSASAASGDSSALGPKKKVSGEPVKVGFIVSGRNATVDSTFQSVTAEATVEFLNKRGGGFAGHPIELVACDSGFSNPGKANECANELVKEGVALVIVPDTTVGIAINDVLSQAQVPLFLNTGAEAPLNTDTPSTFVLNDNSAATIALPIALAKAHKIKKVSPVVIDVPAATAIYTTNPGPAPFKKAGLDMEMTAIPLGQADMTPQMSEIASKGKSVVQIIGNDVFCIPALKGLQAVAFKNPIGMLANCVTDSTRQALGSYLKGINVSAGYPAGEKTNAAYKQLAAINKTYGGNEIEDLDQAMPIYIQWMAAMGAVEGLTGEVTPASTLAAIKSMPNKQLIGSGMWYRCNGKAVPAKPGICMNGTLRTVLDAKGNPTEYETAGNTKVPD
jgi:branched-chain amino acid transport system substrate-binding protein